MFNNRKYLIVNISEINKIDFSRVFQKDENNVRKTLDGTKFFIKWDGVDPNFIYTLQTREGPYDHSSFLKILDTSIWINNNIDNIDELIEI